MEQEKVPVQGQVAERTISLTASWAYFALSIVINSMGNVLTLVTSSHVHPQFLGSAYWTAAENNLGIAVLGNKKLHVAGSQAGQVLFKVVESDHNPLRVRMIP